MGLYDNDYLDATQERLPTLRQYLNTSGKTKRPKKFLVCKIWVPNKYPSYSLETEHFRASVGKSTAIGRVLQNNWSELIESEIDTFLELKLTNDKKTQLKLVPGRTSGSWVDIGTDPVLGISWKYS